MGAQWKHSLRQAAADKKGKIVSKIAKEIAVAAKLGGSDPNSNFRLRTALDDARKASVTRDTIERAIKRGTGNGADAITYETIVYEGFAPHQVPVLVECLTDNRNRTAADIRVLFRSGQLGAAGSVAWMFDRKGAVDVTMTAEQKSKSDPEAIAIESGADDFEWVEDDESTSGWLLRLYTDPTQSESVRDAVVAQGLGVAKSEIGFFAKNKVELTGAALEEASQFLRDLDDHDDVHKLWVGI